MNTLPRVHSKWLRPLALATLFLTSTGSNCATGESNKLSRWFYARGGRVAQGIHIISVQNGKVLFSQNAGTLYSPASVTKLITSAALLHYFGPDYRFKTRIMHDGNRKGPVINGNLIIEGDGDPLFISETLWQLAADLRNMGIREVSGGIHINNSLFGGVIRDEIRLEGVRSSSHAYDAPVTAFGVNFNTIALSIAPGEKAGMKALVSTDPLPVSGFHIDNQVQTSSGGKAASVRATRVSMPKGESRLILSGKIPLNAPVKKIYRSVNDPVLSSGELVRTFFQQLGISVKGSIESVPTTPISASLLTEVKSEPVSKIIAALNLHSNNYIADVMVKRLGAEAGRLFNLKEKDKPGTYDNGMDAIIRFLKNEVGIGETFVLENGSGLTTQNRLSAAQLTRLLVYMAKNWQFFPEFLASLPSAGYSGTLESRFQTRLTSPLQGQVRAKTGTLSSPFNVSSLAGYMHHERHGLLAFAIIQNGQKGQMRPGILDLQESQEVGLARVSRSLQKQ